MNRKHFVISRRDGRSHQQVVIDLVKTADPQAVFTYATIGAALAEGMDRITEKDPTTDHMKGSLHEIGLAQDIDLYKDGKWLDKTEDHLPFGEWWEAYGELQGIPLAWGGRFKDGTHYSFSWKGRK